MDEKLICVSLQSNDLVSFWHWSDHSISAFVNLVELAICDYAFFLIKECQTLKVSLIVDSCLNGSYCP